MKKYICDICKAKDASEKGVSLQVIFDTEQTEGRGCPPYLSMVDVDICKDCYQKILGGNAVFASGAQGYNDYYFRNKQYGTTKT